MGHEGQWGDWAHPVFCGSSVGSRGGSRAVRRATVAAADDICRAGTAVGSIRPG